MRFTPLPVTLGVVVLSVVLTGCAHRLAYDSVNVDPGTSTVANAVIAQDEVQQTFQENPAAVLADVPPYTVDQVTDAGTTAAAAIVVVPVELVKPTVRDVPAIVLNRSTDLVHDGTLAATRTAAEVVRPTANAVERSVVKLGGLVARPWMWFHSQVGTAVRTYSVDSYDGALPMRDRSYWQTSAEAEQP